MSDDRVDRLEAEVGELREQARDCEHRSADNATLLTVLSEEIKALKARVAALEPPEPEPKPH